MGESAVSQLTKERLDLFGCGAEFGGHVHGADHEKGSLALALDYETKREGCTDTRSGISNQEPFFDERRDPIPVLEKKLLVSWCTRVKIVVVGPE